jgi:hypothetical protein
MLIRDIGMMGGCVSLYTVLKKKSSFCQIIEKAFKIIFSLQQVKKTLLESSTRSKISRLLGYKLQTKI